MKRIRAEALRSPFSLILSLSQRASGQVLEAGPGAGAELANLIIFLWDCHPR